QGKALGLLGRQRDVLADTDARDICRDWPKFATILAAGLRLEVPDVLMCRRSEEKDNYACFSPATVVRRGGGPSTQQLWQRQPSQSQSADPQPFTTGNSFTQTHR